MDGAQPRGDAAIDFSTFILSVSTSAVTYLGLIAHPETGEATLNLTLAKQNIDILSMLREKTVGNLTGDEAKLLETLLYDLRMRFLEISQAKRRA
ncbi:MAG: DUF1844 domain-containing protein [Myxococcales bacterium]|nr:DUF1844 domain-containing protein [Myxococcales bacterium]